MAKLNRAKATFLSSPRDTATLAALAAVALLLATMLVASLPASARTFAQQSPVSPLQQPTATLEPVPTATPPAPTPPAPTPPAPSSTIAPPIPIWGLAAIMGIIALIALVVGLRRR